MNISKTREYAYVSVCVYIVKSFLLLQQCVLYNRNCRKRQQQQQSQSAVDQSGGNTSIYNHIEVLHFTPHTHTHVHLAPLCSLSLHIKQCEYIYM